MITDFSKVNEILDGKESGYFNMDCMEGMKEFPDEFFDLAIVDPPYGAGFTEGGGCQGWFKKYHQSFENPIDGGGINKTQSQQDLGSTEVTDGINISRQVQRTGGTWATKYAKKS